MFIRSKNPRHRLCIVAVVQNKLIHSKNSSFPFTLEIIYSSNRERHRLISNRQCMTSRTTHNLSFDTIRGWYIRLKRCTAILMIEQYKRSHNTVLHSPVQQYNRQPLRTRIVIYIRFTIVTQGNCSLNWLYWTEYLQSMSGRRNTCTINILLNQ